MTLDQLISELLTRRIPLRLVQDRLQMGPGWAWLQLTEELRRAIQEHRRSLEMTIALGQPMSARLQQLVCSVCHPEVKPVSRIAADRDETFYCCRCQWSTGHYPRLDEQALRQMRGVG